jgi:phosphate starvation-inducible PhoH-like protein
MQKSLSFRSQDEERALFGTQDAVLKRIRKTYGVRLVARPGSLTIEGDDSRAGEAARALGELLEVVRQQGFLSKEDVDRAVLAPTVPQDGGGSAPFRIIRTVRGSFITPQTEGQREYVDAIRNHAVVFGIGPAGTGKTYLAVAMAMRDLKKGIYRRIVLARPAVEAGEKLGFLPGDFQAKVHPYLRPLYDAIGDVIEIGEMRRLLEQEVLEVVPLAYMRGRTLDEAFIILDEAQNTTPPQMRMFLTRMGRKSKAVITGDVTQIDLPGSGDSGLVHAREVLNGVGGVGFVELEREDIVRHPLVQEIVDAYGDDDRRRNGNGDSNGAEAEEAPEGEVS